MLKPCGFRCAVFVVLSVCLLHQMAFALTVEEILAALPASDSAHAAQLFEQIAAGDVALVVALCDGVMLWEENAEPKIPMALHGLANHVMRPEYMANRSKVARLYENALNKAENSDIQRFFMSLLRVCGDDASLAALAPHLCDAALFDDAILTVEGIGGDTAVALLENAACADMPESFQASVDAALMRMRNNVIYDTDETGLDAMILAATTAPPAPANKTRVAALCREALHDMRLKPHARAAALRALANTDAEAMLPDLITAAKDASPLVWGLALQLATDMPGENVSRAWAKQLAELPESVRPQVIFMLGGRNDAGARAAVRAALAADTLDMRLAACETIGWHGDKRALSDLERAMSKTGSNAEVQAIKTAMLQFAEPDVSQLAAKQAGRGDTSQRIAYLEIIAARRAEQHLRPVRRCLRDSEPKIRRAALNTLAAIGAQEDLTTLFDHLLAEAENAEISAARAAIVAVADRHSLRQTALAAIREHFKNAALEPRTRLLKTLDALGDAAALEETKTIAQEALFGDLQDVRNAALETLGTWRDARATEILLDFFERLEDEETRMAALQQLLIAVPRVITEAPQQLALLEKTAALCRADAERQAVTEAIEKIK